MADKKLSAHPPAVSVASTDTVGVLQPDGAAFKLRLGTVDQMRGRQFFTIPVGSTAFPSTRYFRMPVEGKIVEIRASIATPLADVINITVSTAIMSAPIKIQAGQLSSTIGIQPTYTNNLLSDDVFVEFDITSAALNCNDLNVSVYYQQ
jgi:hypothetical protein